MHEALKGGWCIAQTEGEDTKLVQPRCHGESCILLRSFVHFNLMITATEVECTEIFGTGERIQGVIYARDRIAVLACNRIEPAIVYAKAG